MSHILIEGVVKRDGRFNNFDVQGTLALQVLNDADGFIKLQVLFFWTSTNSTFYFRCHFIALRHYTLIE